MPMKGFGTAGLNGWRTDNNQVQTTVNAALQTGYRHFDTSPVYGNEMSIGHCLNSSEIPRESLFITSKVPVECMGYSQSMEAFRSSLDRLNLSYLDLYLIHWPDADKNIETWRALEELYHAGLVRSLGVSNFCKNTLESLLMHSRVPPVCNQIQIHPGKNQSDLVDYCNAMGIQVVSWSPLGAAQWQEIPHIKRPMNHPTITQIAQTHNISNAQVILRWHYQNHRVAIPKADKVEHIRQNFQIENVILSPEQMARIDQIEQS